MLAALSNLQDALVLSTQGALDVLESASSIFERDCIIPIVKSMERV